MFGSRDLMYIQTAPNRPGLAVFPKTVLFFRLGAALILIFQTFDCFSTSFALTCNEIFRNHGSLGLPSQPAVSEELRKLGSFAVEAFPFITVPAPGTAVVGSTSARGSSITGLDGGDQRISDISHGSGSWTVANSKGISARFTPGKIELRNPETEVTLNHKLTDVTAIRSVEVGSSGVVLIRLLTPNGLRLGIVRSFLNESGTNLVLLKESRIGRKNYEIVDARIGKEGKIIALVKDPAASETYFLSIVTIERGQFRFGRLVPIKGLVGPTIREFAVVRDLVIAPSGNKGVSIGSIGEEGRSQLEMRQQFRYLENVVTVDAYAEGNGFVLGSLESEGGGGSNLLSVYAFTFD